MNATLQRFVGFIMLLIALPTALYAQDLRDPGISEPYHPSFVHYRIGLYFVIREDYARALDEFTQAIDMLPSFGSAYAARGDVYLFTAEYELAIADYTAAIDIYPDFVSALYTRGRAYHALGEVELAAADYVNAIEQLPEYALPYWGLGDLYYEQEQHMEALTNYQSYLTLVVDEPDALVLARVEELEFLTVVETL